MHLGEVLHELAKRKGVVIEEGHLMPDHIHMYISIPPKYAVSNVVGYLKGRVQYLSHEDLKAARGILQASISGQEDILCQQ